MMTISHAIRANWCSPVFFVVMAMLCLPIQCWAFGLGKLTVNSALNQPLDAYIELLSMTPEDRAALNIKLAGDKLFAHYKVERLHLLTELKFAIVEKREKHYINITSRFSIKEQYLDFVLHVQTQLGNLTRRYTALLTKPNLHLIVAKR